MVVVFGGVNGLGPQRVYIPYVCIYTVYIVNRVSFTLCGIENTTHLTTSYVEYNSLIFDDIQDTFD